MHPSMARELEVLKQRFKSLKLQNITQPSAKSRASGSGSGKQDSLDNTNSSNSTSRGGNLVPVKTANSVPGVPGVNTVKLSSIGISPGTPQRMTPKDKTGRKISNIQERLAAAAHEAALESKVFYMETKLKQEAEKEKQRAESGLKEETALEAAKRRMLNDFAENELYQTEGGGSPDSANLSNKNKNNNIQNMDSLPTASVVWTCPPKKDNQHSMMFTAQDEDEVDFNPLKNPISKQASIEYAKKIITFKQEKKEDDVAFEQYMADQQENMINRSRQAKAEMMRQLREQTKEELQNKVKFKAEWEATQKKQMQMDKARNKIAEREKEDKELRELMHVKEIKILHENRVKHEEMQRIEALKQEASKIQMMASYKEVEIIKRQNSEEARMRYLEERRRAVEEKLANAELLKKARMVRKQERAADTRDHFQARIRKGTFKYHNGVFGFYDDVRAVPVEWVQYEDANGVPYYLDPISKIVQYRTPQDADVHHYTDDERREYDAVHGEGAYDAYKADCAFKDGVNRDGGYYNEKGKWIVMDGYYDENYEWVANEGYYDENGKYRKYAKISGDLSFMV